MHFINKTIKATTTVTVISLLSNELLRSMNKLVDGVVIVSHQFIVYFSLWIKYNNSYIYRYT